MSKVNPLSSCWYYSARLPVGLLCLVVLVSVPLAFARAQILPNDPGLGAYNTDLERQWYLSKTRFIDSWGKTTGDNSLIVAVLDTGIDAKHEDLNGHQVLAGYDFINNKEIPALENSDDNGHGTLVAGVLGATVGNGLGISGAVWKIKILPVKVLNASGEGTSESVAKGIRYATDQGASVINLSFGGTGFAKDTALALSITYAFRRDVVLVAAAGNDLSASGNNLDIEPVFPICDDNGQNMVIGVTALDYQDKKPAFANYGRNCIDVSAPGKRILSTIGRDPVTRNFLPDRYAFASGTSLATPLVSAQALLLKALYPQATNRQIRDRIIATSVPVDDKNLEECNGPCQGLLGAGRIDVFQSLSRYISKETYPEGSILEVVDTGKFYEVAGGKRLELTAFVLAQKAVKSTPVSVIEKQVSFLPQGPLAPPLDGTLVKSYSNPTVYYIQYGLKFPVIYSVFVERGFSFTSVIAMPEKDLDSWLTGKLLPPSEGTLLKSVTSPTVYWVVGQALHPISYEFFQARGLDQFTLQIYPESDIRSFPRGESYFR